MKTATVISAAIIGGLLLAAAGYLVGRHGLPALGGGAAGALGAAAAASGSAAAAPGERQVLYWHDPMVPGPRFDKPGKSPFMDMQLVPVYADAGGDTGVKVSAAVQQNLGIRAAAVTRQRVAPRFDAVGTVQFDERLTVAVQTRVAGYVERLLVRAPLERVRQGQALASVFAPDWLAPLNELAALRRAGVADDIVAAARQRLQALSIPPELVRQAEAGGPVDARFTIVAPAGGVVAELGVREGAMVTPGMTLFRIAGLAKVWALVEVPEAQASRLLRGQAVQATLQADAAQTFEGRLTEILPQLSPGTRTLQARFEVANREGRLMPGMLLRIAIAGPSAMRLLVPAEAVIRTGQRAVAIVRKASGAFEPRELQLGLDLGDTIEVTSGLNEGEEVVVSGQFMVDSEARLRSVLGNMAASAAPAAASAASATAARTPGAHVAEGRVESVEPEGITISHGPVPTLNWPEMTMGFGKRDPKAFADVKPGDSVRFEFRPGGPLGYELLSVQRTGAPK